ncbi:MAG: MotA/TolQ/ExbB proton channel family protein [Cytophagaceae bacterium]|nr:MotA/TolQ/ExbB proton channel family protein [Cytophagaceae bacterium]MDW8456481.1 MotA/TolQ/ExbB proton channel family protein [Cytophagaceae bacterium]
MFLYNFLLQISTVNTEVTDTPPETITLLDLAMKGGLIMIPLALLSIVAVYIIFERILNLRKIDKDPDVFLEKIKTLVISGDIKGAIAQCQQFNTPFSRMIERGIQKIGTPIPNIEASIENAGKIEIYQLEKNLSILATISGLAPMLGFLGTVTGMVSAFILLSQKEGTVTTKDLSSGIYEALITTVAGLIVGVIAYSGYNYIVSRIDKIIHQMEYSSIEFLELLQKPKPHEV